MTFASIWQRLSSNAMLERSGEAMQKLDNCIECRECEARCPYELSILEAMQEQLTLYKKALAEYGLSVGI